MTSQELDQRALRIAREIHEEEKPLLTILFGSRATGQYRDGRSDVDIILVQDDPPPPGQEEKVEARAAKMAEDLFKEETPVQIIWQTSAEFNRMRRTVNHVVARALDEGVVMPSNPEEYRSRYEQEYRDEEFEWTVTDERMKHAEIHINTFNNLVNIGSDDLVMGQHTQEALEHALKALISATNNRYATTHNIERITRAANNVDPGLQFEPQIPPEIYTQYAGGEEYKPKINLISDIPDFALKVTKDVEHILERTEEVRELRRASENSE